MREGAGFQLLQAGAKSTLLRKVEKVPSPGKGTAHLIPEQLGVLQRPCRVQSSF